MNTPESRDNQRRTGIWRRPTQPDTWFKRRTLHLIGYVAALFTLILVPSVSAQVTSSSSWQTMAMSNQTGTFTATFTMVPHQNQMDGITGMVKGTASSFGHVACVVRFNPSGQIDARDGSSYAADATVNYSAGNSFGVRMVINVPAKTYSVYITPQGQSEVTLATDYAFRTEQQSVTSLDGWALLGWVGTHTVSNMTWSTQSPFGGTAAAIPGRIQAENYDQGGAGIAYHDTTPGNSGGQHRSDDVDIESTSDSGGGHNVGWVAAGEWMEYTVNVQSAGTYDLEIRAARAHSGSATMRVYVDGVDKSGAITIPSTGGWQSWSTVTIQGLSLSAGQQVMRLSFDLPINLNWVEFTSVGQQPYLGTAAAIPGRIQAENYDQGGAGIAYNDTTSGNSGGQHRSDDVDIESTSDSGGGHNVGWVAAGEWMEYTVNVQSAGTYDLEIRAARAHSGNATMRVYVDGVDKSGAITIPSTGGWQSWSTVTVQGLSLSAGQQVMRLSFDLPINLNWVEFTSAGQQPYHGTAAAIPGRIQAEDYDLGGAGVAYNDTTSGNSGGQYRSDNVDIRTTADSTGAYNVGWGAAGEWLEYAVDVATSGEYNLDIRVARGVTGSGTLRILMNGADVSGAISVPATGGWDNWTTVSVAGIDLSAGTQVMRLSFETSNIDVNWIEFSDSAPTIVSKRIASGMDDVEEHSSGTIDATSTDLELVFDSSTTGNQHVGMRFTGLGIPQGANITTAYIQFTTDELDSGTTSVTIRGEDVNNSSAFTTSSGNVSGRTLTSASVAWNNIPAWNTAGAAGSAQRTPELKSIVQEIVNRSGFGTSSAMTFIITGSGSRTAHSYNGSPSQAPLLHIEYTGGSGGGGDTTPPTAPTNLVATAVSSSQINLSWTASSDNVGVAGYDIYRGGQYRATVSGTSFQDTGLNPDTTYSYVVYAFDAADNMSNASNTAQATTDDDGPPPGNVVYTNSVSRTSAGITFTWTFNCGGNPCATGQFATGDYWVVPRAQNGTTYSAVTITNITPTGVQHGAQVNPDLSQGNTQGLLNMYSSYLASLNVMTQLPYSASPGKSIVKIRSQTSGCGTSAITAGCVTTGNVLTVLSAIPANGGATIFRPPFHGSWKPLFSTSNVRLDRLSRISAMGSGSSPIGDTTTPEGAAAGYQRWVVPQYDINHDGAWSQEFFRATSPHGVMHDYAANQASQMLSDIMSTLGTHSNANKTKAVYTIMQKGIDNYAIFKMGIKFNSGAGQHLGKAAPVAYFAALYDDSTVLNEIRAIANSSTYIGFFQEYSQVRRSPTYNTPIWGDGNTPAFDPTVQNNNERYYWGGHLGEYKARVRGGSGYDNQGSWKDPHRYIDGPGGGPLPRDSRGRNYQHAAAAGPLIGYAFTQLLFPWLKHSANYSAGIEYADRYYKGRNISGFDRGFWARPDPCAPVDSRENDSCSPFHGGGTCDYYKVTWGPNPSVPGDCIKHGGNANTQGRWAAFLSGANPSPVYPVTAHGAWPHELSGAYRLPSQVSSNWDSLRDCLDPAHSSYGTGACSGIGPTP